MGDSQKEDETSANNVSEDGFPQSPLRPLRRVPRRGSERCNNSLNSCDKGSAYLDRTLLALLILSSRAH